MAIDILQTLDVIEIMENFLSRRRPPEEIRNEVDLDYKIEEQSIIIFEIRPQWDNPEEILEHPIAKTTFVKAKNNWKVFWMKSDRKWHGYSPQPVVGSLAEFINLVEEDRHYCFWG